MNDLPNDETINGIRYIAVDRNTFLKWLNYYTKTHTVDNNYFMDYSDYYDFSLSKSEIGTWDYLDEGLIARHYIGPGCGRWGDFFIREEFLDKWRNRK